jgi:hypothetical protein
MVWAGKIEQIWRELVQDFQRPAQFGEEAMKPHWFGFPLDLARTVAEGQTLTKVPDGWIDRLARIGIATSSP